VPLSLLLVLSSLSRRVTVFGQAGLSPTVAQDLVEDIKHITGAIEVAMLESDS
jgi:hypothetical protein